jgi:hypothetical protein
MNRREFLFFTKDPNNSAELSCEQLYMRYVDSTVDGTTSHFFQKLQESLASVTSLRLIEPSWLSCDELQPVQSILEAFRERGGRIDYQNVRSTGEQPQSDCGRRS